MITGFNTDVEHGGRVYHVQTEDKGLDNPVVESLIYTRGEIVTSRRVPYSDLIADGEFSEATIQARMEEQHQQLVREIKLGKFDENNHLPFGHNFVTNRPFDEVVESYLTGEDGQDEPLKVRLMDWLMLEEGTRPTLRLTVTSKEGDSPVADARVCIRIEAEGREPVELFSADTDAQGFVEASFEIPDEPGDSPFLVCEAMTDRGRDQCRQKIKTTRRSS